MCKKTPDLVEDGFPYLASEGVGHPDIFNNLRLVVPKLVAISAVDLRHNELDVLGNQLALLPCHRFTGFVACPHLPIIVLKIHPILCLREQGRLGIRAPKDILRPIIAFVL